MAGGMTPNDGGQPEHLGTLAERIARTKAAEAERDLAARPPNLGHSTADFRGQPRAPAWADALRDAPAEPEQPAKHCWYDGPHGRQAALLLEWSTSTTLERRGRIAVAHLEPDGHWAMIEMWVEQGMLSPA